MNQSGYESAVKAFKKSFTDCDIYPPLPEEGEDGVYNERYIQVDTHPVVHVQDIVNILDRAGLMHSEGPRDLGYNQNPQLKVLGIMPGCVLFEDMAFRPQ